MVSRQLDLETPIYFNVRRSFVNLNRRDFRGDCLLWGCVSKLIESRVPPITECWSDQESNFNTKDTTGANSTNEGDSSPVVDTARAPTHSTAG